MVNKCSAILLFLFVIFPLYAQDVNYRVDIRYIQRLTWAGDEYAMHYEVIIERFEHGRYSRFLRELTDDEFIEVSLPPGNFRYQVIPHDFFGSPIPVTVWIEFEVLRAPDNIEREVVYEPYHATDDKFDFFLGVFWEPSLPLYNSNLFKGENMSFLGAHLRFGIVYGGRSFLNPGLELSASWKMLDETQLIMASINFLGQSRFLSGRFAFNFRAGFGISLVSDAQHELALNLNTFNINLGISFTALVTRNLYIEAGADIPQFITEDHHGYLNPWIGIGVKF